VDVAVLDAGAVVELLGLEPHPEGGYYRQTFADASSTAIYYLIDGPAGWSAWHRVLDRTEVWHAYAGAALELQTSVGLSGSPDKSIHLGRDLDAGERPQAIVPAGMWQRARSTGRWSLAGCTVSPPFTFSSFEIASEDLAGG
jgi:predicted cupin superfamily sugar epimerase